MAHSVSAFAHAQTHAGHDEVMPFVHTVQLTSASATAATATAESAAAATALVCMDMLPTEVQVEIMAHSVAAFAHAQDTYGMGRE